MKERPILFSGPMVRALLEGRKTQTRRVVDAGQFRPGRGATPRDFDSVGEWSKASGRCFEGRSEKYPGVILGLLLCPYGQPDDQLWVRETWQATPPSYEAAMGRTLYAADCPDGKHPPNWRPSIHMPRWACRIRLEVTGVRVERVQDISEADAKAEGFAESFESAGACHERTPARENFLTTFYELNKRAPRDQNPWVWVVEFRRIP